MADTPQAKAEQTYRITTTAQTERTYDVVAADEEQARNRVRVHIKDADLLREGLVTQLPELLDTTSQKINHCELRTEPVADAAPTTTDARD